MQMAKTLTLRIDTETYNAFAKKARAENRTLSNFIETAVKEYITESEFADDAEMAGILANEKLVERLRKGSRDAKRKKGRMID